MKATCRIEKQTKRPAIFFYDEFGILSTYTREEMHGTACVEYYRENTRLAHNFEESSACVNLMQHYEIHCAKFNEQITWVRRLHRANNH